MLINPFYIRFPSSHSALDRVFPAHSPRKALGTCLLGRHRFIWGIITIPLWKNEPYSCGLQRKRVRKYWGEKKEKAKSLWYEFSPQYTHTHTCNALPQQLGRHPSLKSSSRARPPSRLSRSAKHAGKAQILAQTLLSRHNPRSLHPPKKKSGSTRAEGGRGSHAQCC